jgi:hypothetical protein
MNDFNPSDETFERALRPSTVASSPNTAGRVFKDLQTGLKAVAGSGLAMKNE